MALPFSSSGVAPKITTDGDMLSVLFHACSIPAIAVRQTDGVVCDANLAFFDVMRRGKSDTVGTCISDIDIWEGAAPWSLDATDGALSQPTLLRDQRIRTETGTRLTCNISLYPTVHGTGPLLIIIFSHLSESDDAPHFSPKSLLTIFPDDLPVGVYVAKRDMSFVYCNDALAVMLGFASGDEYRNSRHAPTESFSLFHLDGRPVPMDELPIARAISGERAAGVEFMIRRRDTGKMTYCATAFTPIRGTTGAIIGGGIIVRDIDDRRTRQEMEQQYRHKLEHQVSEKTAALAAATAAAEAANAGKTLLLRNVSHEMRTPLNAVAVVTALLKKTNLTYSQAEIVDKLEIASNQLIELINLLLDINQIEEGRLLLREEVFTIGQIVDTVRAMTCDVAKAKGLTLTYKVDRDDEVFIGDSLRLRQMLLNYVSNALKFTHHGRIEVLASYSRHSEDQPLLRLEVRDTGIGISAADLSRLFQPFEQIANPFSCELGSGLGLAITRRMATHMGGETGAESEPGKGSVFWFTAKVRVAPLSDLKLASNFVSPQERLDSEATVRRLNSAPSLNGRILLVEDDRLSRQLLSKLLEQTGLRVDTAEDGVDAIAKSTSVRYDLILMDMQMPNIDGPAAAAAISAQPRHGFLPIIALTANAFDTDRERCTEAGMCDFISKPVNPEMLFDRVARWLARS